MGVRCPLPPWEVCGCRLGAGCAVELGGVGCPRLCHGEEGGRVTRLGAGEQGQDPGPWLQGRGPPAWLGRRDWGPLWFVTASWSPLFTSLQPPGVSLQGGSRARSFPRPALTLVSGGSLLCPLRRVHRHRLSTGHPPHLEEISRPWLCIAGSGKLRGWGSCLPLLGVRGFSDPEAP